MWMRFEDAKRAVDEFLVGLPSPKATSLEWQKYDVSLTWFMKDLISSIGKLPDHLKALYDEIFKEGFVPAKGVPLADKRIMEGYAKTEGIREWFQILLCWLEEGYKRGSYPYQKERQAPPKAKAPRGWLYVANGEKVFLRIRGIDIDLRSSIEKTGRAYPIVLMQLLSLPKVNSVTEDEFIIAAQAQRYVLKKEHEIVRGALDDFIRRFNQSIEEQVSKEHPDVKGKDFIVKDGNAYKVNTIWK